MIISIIRWHRNGDSLFLSFQKLALATWIDPQAIVRLPWLGFVAIHPSGFGWWCGFHRELMVCQVAMNRFTLENNKYDNHQAHGFLSFYFPSPGFWVFKSKFSLPEG